MGSFGSFDFFGPRILGCFIFFFLLQLRNLSHGTLIVGTVVWALEGSGDEGTIVGVYETLLSFDVFDELEIAVGEGEVGPWLGN